ncbi:ectonucleotide pyrophosphatase/phosphodiesterase [Algoriella sp.]|uniref:alkaline phosphatase family protein n=1 Tax=Algoriella sp. TaxID=1872434 RepID=UPI001B15EB45|nr:ectonucleotide pyrophosphatase/phosphodiesterase [Algoriella sp.]MBO6213741.1 alkaline phosphatase family protein [Algoriella sp.]
MKKLVLSLFSVLVLAGSVTTNAQEIENQIVVENRVNDPKQFDKPYVILISADGFRYDYAKKYEATNLLNFAKSGIEAKAMYPSFPSITFPNHYTIVTGMYPIHHGLVGNSMLDVATGERYSLGNAKAVTNAKWYGGTPIWNLAEKNKMISACYYWPGSEAPINGILPTYSYKYSEKSPIDFRIQQVVNWLELPEDKRPHLITFYFPEVDHAGHSFGPDSQETKEAVHFIDQSIKKLNDEVAKTGLNVNFVFVSDHGMTRIDDENPLKLPIKIDDTKVQVVYNGSYVSLFIKDKTDVDSVYNQLKVVKTNQFEVYKTTDVPAKYNFNAKDDRLGRIGEIILIAHAPNYFSNHNAPKGSHGFFVKETPEMKATFMAWGPNFKSGKVIKPFENIQIYPMLAKILGLPIEDKIDGNNQLANKILKK